MSVRCLEQPHGPGHSHEICAIVTQITWFAESFMHRADFIEEIERRFVVAPCVALLGPRQCGKTTLARDYLKRSAQEVHYFDLENPLDLARLEEPMLGLQGLTGLVIIDEIQLRPNLFPILRVLVDQKNATQFLILGSASRDLIQQSSQTLAGRISYIECTPFTLTEVKNSQQLMHRGGFPLSYLAPSDEASFQWRQDYIRTFLERDIPSLGFRVPASTMRRFWMMLSHYHGQTFNASELGKSLGVAHTTVRHYLSILTGTFMVRELLPWYENTKKRQVKSPKIYFRDTGLYLGLLNITCASELRVNPKLGAVWEGYAMEEIISVHGVDSESCFFWGVHQQAELDLLLHVGGKRIGFEFKYKDAPTFTKSLSIAKESLHLDRLIVIYPGEKAYSLPEGVDVIGLSEYVESNSR